MRKYVLWGVVGVTGLVLLYLSLPYLMTWFFNAVTPHIY